MKVSDYLMMVEMKWLNIINLVNHTFARKLRVLEGYEIVFICDDSGSMNTPLGDLSGPFDKMPSRCKDYDVCLFFQEDFFRIS